MKKEKFERQRKKCILHDTKNKNEKKKRNSLEIAMTRRNAESPIGNTIEFSSERL